MKYVQRKLTELLSLFIVKMDAVQKKNIAMMNVDPGSYDRGLKDKKDMPKYR